MSPGGNLLDIMGCEPKLRHKVVLVVIGYGACLSSLLSLSLFSFLFFLFTFLFSTVLSLSTINECNETRPT